MKRSFRFLMLTALPNLAIVAGTAAVISLGTVLFGSGMDDNNVFQTYFGMFPMMQLMIFFLLSFNLSTINLNIALSFGARREDYFLALQGVFGVYTLGGWAIQKGMAFLPGLLKMEDSDHWYTMLSLGEQPFWVYPLVLLTVIVLGCLCGLLSARSKVWRVAVFLMAMVIGVAAVVMVLVWTNHGGWGDLPAILAVGMVLVFVLSEYFLRRVIRRAVVK